MDEGIAMVIIVAGLVGFLYCLDYSPNNKPRRVRNHRHDNKIQYAMGMGWSDTKTNIFLKHIDIHNSGNSAGLYYFTPSELDSLEKELAENGESLFEEN